MIPPIAPGNAPPFKTVTRYFMAATFFFVAVCLYAMLAWEDIHGHYFQPRLLALTHIATLGWITMTIFGAMFQLVPVVLAVPLWSPRLAAWQFWIWLSGVVCLVTGFWIFNTGWHLDIAALLLLTAGYMFIWNMLRTMVRVTTWDLTAYFLLAAVGYFFVTITLGATLAVNLGHAFISGSHIEYLKVHAHFGLIGWVAMVIMGVALRLIPMFAIAHGYSQRPGRIAFWCVNLGLLGTMVEMTFGATTVFMWLYASLILLGLTAYALQVGIVLKVRLRRSLDVSMRHAVVSFTLMLAGAAFGFTAAFGNLDRPTYERVALAYGITALLGFMSSLIMGEMYKILPFLVWYNKYAAKAGLEPVPTLGEMVHGRLAQWTFLAFCAGIAGMVAGVMMASQPVFGAGAAVMFLASLAFAYNIARVFQQ